MSSHWPDHARHLLLGVALLAVGAVAMPGTALAEQLCDEMGSSCICSEPMNANDGRFSEGHDFSDSPNATECDQYTTYVGTWGGAIHETTAEFNMPAGNDVTYVASSRASTSPFDDGGLFFHGRPWASASDARMCIRYYFMVTNDYSGTGDNNIGCPSERNKMGQVKFGNSNTPFQTEEYQSTGPRGCTGPPGSGLDPYEPFIFTDHEGVNWTYDQNLDWTDCNEDSGWCRYELCVAGDLDAGQNITVDTSITTLTDGRSYTLSNLDVVDNGRGLSEISADIFHGQGVQPVGTRYISHFMQAAWSTDDGQFIGAAYEVEGGGGPGPDPDPIPDPDPDPIPDPDPEPTELLPPTLLD